eukprot:Ihof_evm5s560 gene=Ihof_evmTU5s560
MAKSSFAKHIFACLMVASALNMAYGHLASQLTAHMALESNYPGPITEWTSEMGAGGGFLNNFTVSLDYKGNEMYTDNNWALYFHFVRRVLASQDRRFQVEQITGDLNKITPTAEFEGFENGETVYISLVTEDWLQYETDFFPRIFIVDESGKPMLIENTESTDIYDYAIPVTPAQFKKSSTDKNIYQTGPIRHYNNRNLTIEDVKDKIIPTPLELVLTGKLMADISNGVSITGDLPTAQNDVLMGRFEQLGFKSGNYEIKVNVNPDAVPSISAKADGYTLKVNLFGATVTGYDVAGAFYGVQSIIALTTVGESTIPCVEINDAPRFPYRGEHADIARNFQSLDTLLKTLDQMAAYKLNKFLLHASDDEGWRVEIPGLPELTELGSQRCFDPTETKCMVPQLGSGAFTNNSGSGFLSIYEYTELVRYAAARNIEVIPEFDMPGHARAAVVSMELRYNRTGDSTYRLVDPDDTTRLATVQYFNRLSLLNPCQPSVENFVTKVISEIKIAHENAGVKLTSWSFGGDEAKDSLEGLESINPIPKSYKGDLPIWSINNTVSPAPLWRETLDLPFTGSPICRAYMKEHNIANSNAMTSDLAMRVSKIVKSFDIENFQTWQDALLDVEQLDMALPTAAMDWDALFWGSSLNVWANKGFSVITACADFVYFDQPYETNPNNRGFYWASSGTTMKKVFGFAPINLPQNAETANSRDNATFSLPSPSLGKRSAKEIVKGLQGNVWTETVWADKDFDYMLFPRMLALAERAWHQAGFELEYTEGRTFTGGETHYVNTGLLDEEYNTFINVVGQRELAKLDKANIFYRVPAVGAIVENGVLKANCEIPGVKLEYSLDNSNNWNEVIGQPEIDAPRIMIRALSGQGNRHGLV